jgi:hypothetical protein
METICTALHAAPIQIIGKILIVYKPNPDADLIPIKKMPRHKGNRLTKKQLASKT